MAMGCRIKTKHMGLFSRLVSKVLKMEWNGNKRAVNTGTNIHANIYDPVPALLLLRPRPHRGETPRKQKGFVKAKMVTLPWDDSSPSPHP